jgi:hydrogenase nickel incorporation protein HypB
MKTQAVASDTAAEENRRALRAAGVYCVGLFGGPGCGKTTLLDQTIARLAPAVRAGAIVCDGRPARDRELLSARHRSIVEVDAAGGTALGAAQVRDALAGLDLDALDVLLIENEGSMSPAAGPADLGQEATVAVFSVAAGEDKARKHPEMIEAADAVVLNKLDLTLFVPFDFAAFRADVERAKPSVEIFGVSALHARGLEPWLVWLRRHARKRRRSQGSRDASRWFG